MSLVTKDCFPEADKCNNCVRKISDQVKKKPGGVKDYKRCSGCHLLTYCDKDCQREHWDKVHKYHCKFLSGKVQVQKHDPSSCTMCIQERELSPTQIRSQKSPKTSCTIEENAILMKKHLGMGYGFHEGEKKGHCSLEFACELPFPLGEVSGQYVEKDGTGLDVMLAHSLKILNTMSIKAQEDHRIALNLLENDVFHARSQLWVDILDNGITGHSHTNSKNLSDQVKSLQINHGVSDPWWKCLKFSVDFIVTTHKHLPSNFYDSQSLEDKRFENLKLFHDYLKSQLDNQAKVSEEKSWPNFLLWPSFKTGSLVVRIPPSTRCQSCHAKLFGEVAVSPEEFLKSKSLPALLPNVGGNGALMATCSFTKNKNCFNISLLKDVKNQMQSNEAQWKKVQTEIEIFTIKSRDCDLCIKKSLSSHRCSACLAVQYCSTDCQMKDLDFHKTVCATWAKDKSRSIKGKDGHRDYWKSYIKKQ